MGLNIRFVYDKHTWYVLRVCTMVLTQETVKARRPFVLVSDIFFKVEILNLIAIYIRKDVLGTLIVFFTNFWRMNTYRVIKLFTTSNQIFYTDKVHLTGTFFIISINSRIMIYLSNTTGKTIIHKFFRDSISISKGKWNTSTSLLQTLVITLPDNYASIFMAFLHLLKLHELNKMIMT